MRKLLGRTGWPRPGRDCGPALLCAAVGAVAGALVAMWFGHTSGLHDVGGYVVALGQLAGLMAGYSTLVLVALMARVPVVERAVGADRLARWHSRAGRYTMLLLVVHVVSITTGYAIAARVSLARESAVLVRSYPGIVLAVVAAALLVVVAFVSAGTVRRRLRYESWYLLHLVTYAAVLMAVFHQVADGVDFAYHPVDRAAWIGLYALVGGLVVRYRLVEPVWQAVRQRMTVASVRTDPADVIVVTLQGRHVPRLRAEPGQFFRLRFLSKGLWWQSHPFSLSAAPAGPHLQFAVKAVGDFSSSLRDLVPGSLVMAEGPFGALTNRRRRRAKVLLLAGGIGIAPLRALFESLPAREGHLALLYRCRADADIAFRVELDAVAAARGATVVYLLGRTSELGDPLGPEALLERFPDVTERDVFICGPAPMTARVSSALHELGVPRNQVHLESYQFAGTPLPRSRRGALNLASVAVVGALFTLRSVPAQHDGPMVRTVLGTVTAEGGSARSAAPVRTVVGPAERTLFSTVQVEVTLSHGRLIDVRAISLPNLDAHSRQLSTVAAPILRREALASNGGDIHAVSGATYTSEAYARSMQGALDAQG